METCGELTLDVRAVRRAVGDGVFRHLVPRIVWMMRKGLNKTFNVHRCNYAKLLIALVQLHEAVRGKC